MTLYMPLFRSCTTLRTLTQLHGHLVVNGLHCDPLACTKLIESYAQMGSLQSSRTVFEAFQKPDSFMWGVLIKCCVWNHFFQEAISLYHNMIYQQAQICSFVFPPVLRACSGFGDLGIGGEVHGRIIKCGFDFDAVIETSLLCMYGEIGCSGDARKVFDKISVRDVVSWSSMISSYVENGEPSEGLEMFHRMVLEGGEPDIVTMFAVAEACSELGFLRLAKSVHSYVVRKEIESNGSLANSLIVMYTKCGDMGSGERIFWNINNQSTASCTAMISSYNLSGCFQEALNVFIEMLALKVEPNSVTIMSILSCCTNIGWLQGGKSIHCYVIRRDMEMGYEFLGPALIELYAECGKLSNCENVFRAVGHNNIVSWNMLISFYAHKGLLKEAVVLFVKMQTQGVMPDSFSLASALSACGNAGLSQLGHQIHGHIIRRGYFDEFVQNSLIDMHLKCGFVDSAYMMFQKTQQRSLITWNSMICGLSQNGKAIEAIHLFDQMYLDCLDINSVTFLGTIQACSHLGYLEKGKWTHHKVIVSGVAKDLYIDTALTDMYAKCGDLRTAQRVFDSIPQKSIVSWSAMIAGYGMHGHINAAISLFAQMIESGTKPNEVAFMNILSACSHSGSIEEGKIYFDSMKDFGVKPNSEHHVCMVDLLSRAGDLDGAYKIINSMSFPANSSTWGALLNGCRIHQRLDITKIIERDLMAINTDDTGYYTLLSNLYAEEGNWGKFRKVRSVIRDIGLRKVPGYSTIEVDKKVYRFGAGDEVMMVEMYNFLENFRCMAQEHCYHEVFV